MPKGLSIFSKIKKAFSNLKSKFPFRTKKEEKVIDKEIEKQSKIINDTVLKRLDDIENELKMQKEENIILKKNIFAQPPRVQQQIQKTQLKAVKKRRFRKLKGENFTLKNIYSWRVGYYPEGDYFQIDKVDNIEIESSIKAKTINIAIEKAVQATKQIGATVKNQVDSIAEFDGNRVYIYEIDHQSSVLFDINGNYVYDIRNIVNFSEKR